MNLGNLVRALKRTDLILTPAVERYLVQHGDDPYPDWVLDKLFDTLRTPPRDRSGSFSGSAAGQCMRAQELAFAGVPQEPTDAQLQNIYNDGKWRHLRWQGMLLTLGLIEDIEYLVRWPQYLSRGSLDGRGVVGTHQNQHWTGLEFGFELKGVSTFQFGRLVKEGPMEKHLKQVDHYFALGCFDLFVIVYEDKTTQAWKEWVIEPDPARIRKAEEQIWALAESVDTKTLHAQLPDCAKRTGETYNQCGFGRNGQCARARRTVPTPFVRSN